MEIYKRKRVKTGPVVVLKKIILSIPVLKF